MGLKSTVSLPHLHRPIYSIGCGLSRPLVFTEGEHRVVTRTEVWAVDTLVVNITRSSNRGVVRYKEMSKKTC